MIIVFSGTDGAGKSTQIEILQSKLKGLGFKTLYVWSRGGYTPLFSLLKSFARCLLRRQLPSAGQSEARDAILRKGFVSKLWLRIAIIDLIFFYGCYIRLMSMTGHIVICDRYLKDTFLDFRHNFPDTFNPQLWLWRCLEFVTPIPDTAFLLHVPVAISQERSRLKNEPFPDTEETLRYRLACYLDDTIFSPSVYNRIDCQCGIEDVARQVWNEIEAVRH